MMGTEETIIYSVEIQVPLEIVKEALIQTERDELFTFERRCILPTHELVNVTFMNLKTHLKITFDKLQFLSTHGVNKCILLNSEIDDKLPKTTLESKVPIKSTLNIQSAETEMDHATKIEPHAQSSESSLSVQQLQKQLLEEPLLTTTPMVKQKRGRPRKIKVVEIKSEKIKPNSLKSTDEYTLSAESMHTVTEDTNSALENTVDKLREADTDKTKHACTEGKRYSLRGRKLNSKIMASVKGSTEADFDDHDENSGNCTNNEEHLYMSDDDAYKSDFEPSERKRNRQYTDSKEKQTKERNISKQVNDILSEISVSRSKVACKLCEKKHYNYEAVYKHVMKTHKPDTQTENLDEYLEELVKLKMVTCNFCGESFADSEGMKSHEDLEHKNFSCPLCDYNTKMFASLKTHVRNMHLETGKKAFCHLCTASFRSQGSLKQHIDLNHYGNKHVTCDVCQKKFYNKSQLRRHMRVHNCDASKRLYCELCNKCFAFQYNLKRHIRAVHQPQSECYHCSYCGKGFSQKVPMISHVQLVHFSLFPYSCKLCKGSFPRGNLLKEHMLSVHLQHDFEVEAMPRNSVYDKSDEDKFYCSYCSEGFIHKIRLIEHMHGDHADAFPFKCETCVQGFLQKSFLGIHMLKAHGMLIHNDDVVAEAEAPQYAADIMQIISTKAGCPNRIVQAVSGEEIFTVNEETCEEALIESCDGNQDTDTVLPDSSIVLQVARGSNTYRVVIEAPESLRQSGSETVVQDISNLLMAAEHTVQESHGELVFEKDSSSVQNVNLVIDDTGQRFSTSTENQAQTVHESLSQNEQNMSLLTSDNQEQPMEIVIDQSEQNSAVFTIENQAEPLQIQHGDIIELNDSNSADGTNYYRIINVLDNFEENVQSAI